MVSRGMRRDGGVRGESKATYSACSMSKNQLSRGSFSTVRATAERML